MNWDFLLRPLVYVASKHGPKLLDRANQALSGEKKTIKNEKKTIKKEIDRRLWVCDMWLKQLDEGKTQQSKALSAIVNEQLKGILDYWEKYYGISAGEDRKILRSYLQARNEEEIRNKLDEYKKWWRFNK